MHDWRTPLNHINPPGSEWYLSTQENSKKYKNDKPESAYDSHALLDQVWKS